MPYCLRSFNILKVDAKFLLGISLMFVIASCSETFFPGVDCVDCDDAEKVYMAASIKFDGPQRTSRTGTVNTDVDDQINSIRLIISNSADGVVVYNQYHNPTDFISNPPGVNVPWTNPFEIKPGTYDFFFIANEESWNLTTDLIGVTNAAQLYTDPKYTRLAYEPTFKPSLLRPVIYTRVYRNVVVPPRGIYPNAIGTQLLPQHFQAEGDEEVELIRTLAKVTLTVKNCVRVDNVGGVFKPVAMKFRYLNTMKQLELANVPQYFSLFLNPYLGSDKAGWAPGKKTTADFYAGITPPLQYQTHVVEATPTTALMNSEVNYVQASYDPVTNSTTYFDYVTTLYIPEHLRAYNASEHTTPLPLFVSGATTWNFQNHLGVNDYRLTIDHEDFTTTTAQQSTGNGQFFKLPDPGAYSRFSTLRNTWYKIEAEEQAFKLHVKHIITPWTKQELTDIYVSDYFNVVVENKTFPGGKSKVRIITSQKTLPPIFKPSIQAASGIKIDGTPGGTLNHNAAGNQRDYQNETVGEIEIPASLPTGSPLFDIKSDGELLFTVKMK